MNKEEYLKQARKEGDKWFVRILSFLVVAFFATFLLWLKKLL